MSDTKVSMDEESPAWGLDAFDPKPAEEKKSLVPSIVVGPSKMEYFTDESVKASPPCREMTPQEGAMLIGSVTGGTTFFPPYTSDYKGDFYAPPPGLPGEHVGADLDSWVLNHLPHTTTFQTDWTKYLPEKVKQMDYVDREVWLAQNPEEQAKLMDRCHEEMDKQRKEMEDAIMGAFVDQRKGELTSQRKGEVDDSKKSIHKTNVSKKLQQGIKGVQRRRKGGQGD